MTADGKEPVALEAILLAIEERLWSGGEAAYREHVDGECLLAFTEMAGVMTRDQVAATVAEGPRWRDVEMDLQGLVRPTPETALLTYRASAVRGADEHYRALVSSAYVLRGGHWKLAFHHQTPLTD